MKNMNRNMIKTGFMAAALANIVGVLLFSRVLTNEAINNADPVVMSNFGLMMIMVWGLTYLGTAFVEGNIRWIAAAFTIEKLVYVVVWLRWHLSHDIEALYATDSFAGVFYTIYGLNDFMFMLFFGFVFWKQSVRRER